MKKLIALTGMAALLSLASPVVPPAEPHQGMRQKERLHALRQEGQEPPPAHRAALLPDIRFRSVLLSVLDASLANDDGDRR